MDFFGLILNYGFCTYHHQLTTSTPSQCYSSSHKTYIRPSIQTRYRNKYIQRRLRKALGAREVEEGRECKVVLQLGPSIGSGLPSRAIKAHLRFAALGRGAAGDISEVGV